MLVLQMDLWGTMNELMGLAHATTPDESMMYYTNVFNRTDNIAQYELQLLLGNENFSTVYFQSASEVWTRDRHLVTLGVDQPHAPVTAPPHGLTSTVSGVTLNVAQISLVTDNGCAVQQSPRFGAAPSMAQVTITLAQCTMLMNGVMLGGEYSGYQFFVDYARVMALRMSTKSLSSPMVRFEKAHPR